MSSNPRYEFLERLDTGGVGVVFAAMDTTLHRKVAIKRLKELGVDDTALGDLRHETAILCKLHHPNIVRVLDFGGDEEGPFVVMDFLQGRTLHDWVRDEGALMEADSITVARQCLEALVAAQAQHVLHRDLKPGNVMLHRLPSGSLHVTLVDFGLAKHVMRPMAQTAKVSASVLGTAQFMAPEQFMRRPLDVRTDLFSLGCVFYFALTRLYPFPGKEPVEVIKARENFTPEPLENLRPDLPVALCRWVHWLMEAEPNDRPANASAALEKLVGFQSQKTKADENPDFFYSEDRPLPKVISLTPQKPASAEETPAEEEKAPPARPPGWRIAVMLIAAGLLCLGGYFWWLFGRHSNGIGLVSPRMPGKSEWYRRPLGESFSDGVVWLRWQQPAGDCWGLAQGNERALKFTVTRKDSSTDLLEVRAFGRQMASEPFPNAATHTLLARLEFGADPAASILRVWMDPSGDSEPAADSALVDMELPEPLAFDGLLHESTATGLADATVTRDFASLFPKP